MSLARQARSRRRLLRAAKAWASLTGAALTGPHRQSAITHNRAGERVRVTVAVSIEPAPEPRT